MTLAEHASTIDVLAVSGISLFPQHQGFYRRKLERGARIRIILLNPDCAALPIHAYQAQQPDSLIRNHIESTIAAIGQLMTHEGEGQLELRLGRNFAPFSLVGADMGKNVGRIVVEFHVYRAELDRRLHVVLDAQSQPALVDFYRGQFEAAWSISDPISAEAASAWGGRPNSSDARKESGP